MIQIKPGENQIVLGDELDLLQKEMIVTDLNWISGTPIIEPVDVTVKIRYKSKEAPAKLGPVDENRFWILFDEPQKGVAPGQSAVFYRDKQVLGGGVID